MFFMRAVFLSIVAASLLMAQAPSEPPEVLTFKTGATLVRIDAQVLDRGRPLAGLTAADFIVKDNGVVQELIAFGQESEPLQVLFVLDVSGSMGRLLRQMADVAQSALATLGPEDEVGVMLYSRHSRITQELVPDRRAALVALQEAPLATDLGAGTAMNEALLAACSLLKDRPPFAGRRAIVVLTDNGGLNELAPDQAVLQELGTANAVLNAIVTRDAKPPAPPRPGVEMNPAYTFNDVFLLARESGGEVLRADRPERFREMIERIRLRYGLGYRAPDAAPGEWRRVEVELSEEARKKYRRAEVRARPGYLVPGEAAAPVRPDQQQPRRGWREATPGTAPR
jgi:VWFA-related protein